MNSTQANYLAAELPWERDIFNNSFLFLTGWVFVEANWKNICINSSKFYNWEFCQKLDYGLPLKII